MSDENDNDRHPDDIAEEQASIAEAAQAAQRIDVWIDEHKDLLKQVIQAYADSEAEELWWELRESFWARQPISPRRLANLRKKYGGKP